MSEWISVKDKLPKNLQDVYMKTDCDNCLAMSGLFCEKFIFMEVAGCQKHWDNELELFRDRITHWMPVLETPRE